MSTYLAKPLDFPSVLPPGFEAIADEPVFDPSSHLQIELPDHVLSLRDLGYSQEAIDSCPSSFAVSSVFRLLSDEGAACLLDVCRTLQQFATSNPRISRTVRGGVYRSRFLRDLCLCPELTDAMSNICGTALLPHTMPHQLGHLNYNPLKIGENVDKWHVDTLRFDTVLFVTDPTAVEGGEFEFYRGTKEEVAARHSAGEALDPARIVAPEMPGPGYAVLQQGNMVVHRARGIRAPGERITLVNGYVPRDIAFPDFNRFDQLCLVDPVPVVAGEYARHMAWMTRERLDAKLQGIAFCDEPASLAEDFAALAQSIDDSAKALREAGRAKIEHFGDG